MKQRKKTMLTKLEIEKVMPNEELELQVLNPNPSYEVIIMNLQRKLP